MPKVAKSSSMKLREICDKFKGEFIVSPINNLYCKLCDCTVKYDKVHFVESHRQSAKHQSGIQLSTKAEQTFIRQDEKSAFVEDVVTAFLAADIPLKKLQNEKIKSLFEKMGKKLPSESTCRNRVTDLADREKERVKELISDQLFFLVVDESEISGRKYINILIGTLINPSKVYMLSCIPLSGTVNSQVIIVTIDDTIRYLNCDRDKFCLLLSDAAPYMIAAARTLKSLYSQLFHITCMAHLLHNCALRVKSHFENVDNLIAKIKAATVKNKTRQDLFREIGKPPEPVITRWSSWLKAAFYYSDHLPVVREIVSKFEGGGILVTNAKASVATAGLESDLMQIKVCYSPLVEMLKKTESTHYSIQDAYEDITSLNLDRDPAKITEYVKKRIENHEIHSIMQLTRSEISPSTYG